MKKRLLALILTGMMVISLAACSSSDTSSDTSDSEDASSDVATEETDSEDSSDTASSGSGDYKIEMVVKHSDEHFKRVMAGAEAYAEETGITVDIVSPTSASDYDGQMNSIETSLSNDEYDALVIAPLQSETVATLVEGTEKVIVALDTDFESDYKSTYVGTGNEDAAYSGTAAAVALAQENGIESPTCAIITGTQGDETHEARKSGIETAIEEGGGEIVDTQYAEATAEKATTAMEGIIQKFPDGVDIVVCTDDNMAVAVAKVISDSGNENYINNTILVGFDGTQEAIELVESGNITIEIAQMGYEMGYLSVEAAVAVLNGETVDSYIDSGSELVTADNVADYIADMESKGLWDMEE